MPSAATCFGYYDQAVEKLPSCHLCRPKTGRGSGQDRKRKAVSHSAEAGLLPIKCGPLTGRLDLQQGSVRLSSDFSELSAVRPLLSASWSYFSAFTLQSPDS